MKNAFEWNVDTHNIAREHLEQEHNLDEQDFMELFDGMTYGEIVIHLRAEGKCVHHISGFDDDKESESE